MPYLSLPGESQSAKADRKYIEDVIYTCVKRILNVPGTIVEYPAEDITCTFTTVADAAHFYVMLLIDISHDIGTISLFQKLFPSVAFNKRLANDKPVIDFYREFCKQLTNEEQARDFVRAMDDETRGMLTKALGVNGGNGTAFTEGSVKGSEHTAVCGTLAYLEALERTLGKPLGIGSEIIGHGTSLTDAVFDQSVKATVHTDIDVTKIHIHTGLPVFADKGLSQGNNLTNSIVDWLILILSNRSMLAALRDEKNRLTEATPAQKNAINIIMDRIKYIQTSDAPKVSKNGFYRVLTIVHNFRIHTALTWTMRILLNEKNLFTVTLWYDKSYNIRAETLYMNGNPILHRILSGPDAKKEANIRGAMFKTWGDLGLFLFAIAVGADATTGDISAGGLFLFLTGVFRLKRLRIKRELRRGPDPDPQFKLEIGQSVFLSSKPSPPDNARTKNKLQHVPQWCRIYSNPTLPRMRETNYKNDRQKYKELEKLMDNSSNESGVPSKFLTTPAVLEYINAVENLESNRNINPIKHKKMNNYLQSLVRLDPKSRKWHNAFSHAIRMGSRIGNHKGRLTPNAVKKFELIQSHLNSPVKSNQNQAIEFLKRLPNLQAEGIMPRVKLANLSAQLKKYQQPSTRKRSSSTPPLGQPPLGRPRSNQGVTPMEP